jgi:DNA-binding transcriptional regulator/RsmH inhibitor MraZ
VPGSREASPVDGPAECGCSPGEATLELVGEPFVRTLEEPGLRLKFPNAIVEAIGEVLMILLAEGQGRKWLAAVPLARWREVMRGELQRARNPGEDRQALLRRLAAHVARVEVSRDGRITLPKHLTTQAGIKNEVTVWPRIDRLEIVAGRELPTPSGLKAIEPLYHDYQGGVPGLL